MINEDSGANRDTQGVLGPVLGHSFGAFHSQREVSSHFTINRAGSGEDPDARFSMASTVSGPQAAEGLLPSLPHRRAHSGHTCCNPGHGTVFPREITTLSSCQSFFKMWKCVEIMMSSEQCVLPGPEGRSAAPLVS